MDHQNIQHHQQMDPYHITEFASPRYFSKLDQQHQQQQQQQHVQTGPIPQGADEAFSAGLSCPPPPPPPTRSLEESTFLLPLRPASSEIEYTPNILKPIKETKKRRFALFSRKTTGSQPGSSEHRPRHRHRRRSSVADIVPEPPVFHERFFALPNELQMQVISSLPLSDILSLRLLSKSWHALITDNEAPIARYHLDHHVPKYATRLYPLPANTKPTLHYLCGIWHRLHVAAKLSFLMCEWITKDIFLRKTEADKQEFAQNRERMRRRLIPLVFTIFHFFETYRTLHVDYMAENGHGVHQTPYTLNPLELKVMEMYDPHTLLRVHEVFPLVLSSFCRRLRPPSYVGRVEGALRGYLRDKPSDEVHAATLIIGGLRQVERFWEIKGYNLRRSAVDTWYSGILRQPTAEAPPKKRGFLTLSRKKSFYSPPDSSRTHPSPDDAESLARGLEAFHIHSSLTAGVPMGPLPKDDVLRLLADLPSLQQIWSLTAEAVILEKKIVERPSDIRRNAQVMLELIRETGWDDEDEWWYGSGSPESVRLPSGATDDDLY